MTSSSGWISSPNTLGIPTHVGNQAANPLELASPSDPRPKGSHLQGSVAVAVGKLCAAVIPSIQPIDMPKTMARDLLTKTDYLRKSELVELHQ